MNKHEKKTLWGKALRGLGLPLPSALALVFAVMISACNLFGGSDKDDDPTPPVTPATEEGFEDFYNYPSGRADSTGTLTIGNNVASPVLLFTSDVSPANYIGTVGSLSSVKVKLPEQKFYTIVAVDKANWQEKGAQAAQYSELTYYSNTQGYSITVSPDNMSGAGQWIINNYTTYWVALKKSDLSANYAVVAPNAKRVIVPIQIGANYDYVPHYFKELKYDGRVIALIESDQQAEADTATTTETRTSFTTNLGQGATALPTTDLKPAIYFTNSSDKTVRVYVGSQNQLSATGVSGTDFALVSGATQMFTSGIDEGVHTNTINFNSTAWAQNKFVSQDVVMQKNKVYRIVLNGPNQSYSTTVTEQDAEEYFN
jgi:hypothetical protein